MESSRPRRDFSRAGARQHRLSRERGRAQGYRSALGILRLAKKFSPSRLEQACEKALAIQAPSYKTIKTLLEQRMEAAPLRGGEAATGDAAAHLGATNVRGRGYYH